VTEETRGGAPGGAVTVLGPGEGRAVRRRFGEHTIIKVAAAETRGAYAVRENAVPAGFAGVPLHVHHEAEEAFYVLEGELTVYTSHEAQAAPAGTIVLIPRGAAHAIANRGSVGVRWVTVFSPAWVSDWIVEESELLESSPEGAPDPDALAAIAEKYGLEVLGPPPDEPAPQRVAG
jgi:mannose-6-phosphate isomerase-like protein (cupin superfamily)